MTMIGLLETQDLSGSDRRGQDELLATQDLARTAHVHGWL